MERRDFLAWAALPALMNAANPKLPNAVFSTAQAKVTHETFGELHVYFDGPTDQLKSMTAGSLRLNPGAEPHPPHTHDEEEIMVIVEGTGEISMEGKITHVGPGAMMYSAAKRVHGIRNTGRTPLLFYYYKWLK